MSPLIRLTLAISLFSVSLVATVATAAERPRHIDRRVVGYSDLDVTRRHGAEALYQRIESAARDVCRKGHSRPLVLRANARRCVEDAIADAVADVDEAAVTARHTAR